MLIDKLKVIDVYSPGKWVDLAIFQGNYFNFGYWENKTYGSHITNAERIRSSEKLYDVTIDNFSIGSHHRILEIGCGRGIGTTFIAKKYNPENIIGIDITPSQIREARNFIKNVDMKCQINFFEEDICKKTRFQSASFDFIYSVEAIQHFYNIENLAMELNRIIAPHGHIAISGCFATLSKNALLENAGFQNIKELEIHYGINEVIRTMKNNNLHLLLKKDISNNVFPGYNHWLHQCENIQKTHSFAFYYAYKLGLIKYYVLHFKKV